MGGREEEVRKVSEREVEEGECSSRKIGSFQDGITS